MSLLAFKKGSGQKLSAHFSSDEFDCPCSSCKTTFINSELILKLEKLRRLLKTKLGINPGGGYRCASYQQDLRLRGYETASGKSTHEEGKAADISNGVTPGHELKDTAEKAGFRAIGVGKNWLHVDIRDDKVRLWYYK